MLRGGLGNDTLALGSDSGVDYVYFETALDPGTYEFSYQIRASLPGEYLTLPPTASQMYFPEVWGRGAGSTFTVTE